MYAEWHVILMLDNYKVQLVCAVTQLQLEVFMYFMSLSVCLCVFILLTHVQNMSISLWLCWQHADDSAHSTH